MDGIIILSKHGVVSSIMWFVQRFSEPGLSILCGFSSSFFFFHFLVVPCLGFFSISSTPCVKYSCNMKSMENKNYTACFVYVWGRSGGLAETIWVTRWGECWPFDGCVFLASRRPNRGCAREQQDLRLNAHKRVNIQQKILPRLPRTANTTTRHLPQWIGTGGKVYDKCK